MQKNTFSCPHCGGSIDLGQIEEHQIEERLKSREVELEKEIKLRAKDYYERQAQEEKKRVEEEQKRAAVELEMLKKRDEDARKRELDFMREKAALENKQKDLELEKERAIIEARKVMEGELAERLKKEQGLSLERMQMEFEKKIAERDKQMEILQKSLAEANQKASQGSMQIQGEIQEDALKALLTREFPSDLVDDVPTGIKGADLVHSVRTQFGQHVGVIAWESKNTKAWSDSWVDKLKEDRLRVNAGVSVIVSSVLPEGINHFGLYKGIWVTEWQYVLPLTLTIRDQMISMDHLRNSLAGKDEKMEVLYNYLTSTEFRDKIQNIVEAFTTMKDQLDSEKRAMERIWANREKQLERVISNTARLYGDMQGLIGAKLPGVSYFELEAGEPEDGEETI
ncbi:MAG: DUF2130 domain-containing protein [Patescibacteria group bacterium]